MYVIERDFYFSAAHYLPGHPKCGELHGHNWKVTVAVHGEPNAVGMVVDFGTLKRQVEDYLKNIYDHQTLNDQFTHPTAENLARRMAEDLKQTFQIAYVLVEETRDSRAIYLVLKEGF